jgi:hypothetical protein
MNDKSNEAFAQQIHRSEPVLREKTAYQLALLAQEVIEALKAANAEGRVIVRILLKSATRFARSRPPRMTKTSTRSASDAGLLRLLA